MVLDDGALAQYCMWRDNLDQAKGKEWDSFVLSLKPGEDLEGRLKDFRFSAEQQKELDKQKSDLAQEPRELILTGLKSEKEEENDTKTRASEE